MADTSSIASRMEKLAQLKRMKLERAAAGNSHTNTPSPTDSLPETTQETTILPSSEESFALDDEQHVVTPETSAIENAAPVEPEAFDPFDEVDSDVSNANPGEDLLNDDSENLTVHAQDTDAGIFSETDEQDLDTELPADLLDIEETAETADVTNSDDIDYTENEVAIDDQEEMVGTADIPEIDINEEVLIASTLSIDDEEPASSDEVADTDRLDEDTSEIEAPNFAENEIDPTVLEREFEHEAEQAVDAPTATVADDGKVTLTFDESRSTLLNHVSRQMDCAPEDVVVTALDWYLDALFGEENDEAKSA